MRLFFYTLNSGTFCSRYTLLCILISVLSSNVFASTDPVCPKAEIKNATALLNESLEDNFLTFSNAIAKIKDFSADYSNKEGFFSLPLVRALFWLRVRNHTYSDVIQELAHVYPAFDVYKASALSYIKRCDFDKNMRNKLISEVYFSDLQLLSSYKHLLNFSKYPHEFERYLIKINDELNKISSEMNTLNSRLEILKRIKTF